MKKIILSILILMSLNISAQTEPEDVGFNIVLRHIKGVQGVEAYYGFSQLGGCFEVNYHRFLSKEIYIMPGFNFEAAGVGLSVFKDYSVHLAFGFTLFKIGTRFYFNMPVGGYLGIENISAYQDASIGYVYPGDSRFIFGAFLGINPELFISKRLALVLNAKQIYIGNCPFGKWKYEAMVGLRLIIK